MNEQIEQTLTSLEVAEMVGKNHADVMRDIRRIISHLNESRNALVGESKNALAKYFEETTYEDVQGKQRSSFLLTKKGCELFSTRMTGAKGTKFAVSYIERFNEMENHIKQVRIPTSQLELVQLALSANEETNQRVDEIDDRLTDIEMNKLITTEDKGTIDAHVRKRVHSICKDFKLEQKAKSILFQELGSSIKKLFNVPNRGRLKDKDFISALEFIDSWQPSSVTKAQIKQLDLF